MRCSHCGKPVTDGLALCSECRRPAGVPSFWARLWQGLGRLFTPRHRPIRHGEPLIYDNGMLSHLPPDLRRQVLDGLDKAESDASGRRTVNINQSRSVQIPLKNLNQLPPELRKKIEEARASGQTEVQIYSEVTTIDPFHGKRVQRAGTPLDPKSREQIESLMRSDPAEPIPLEPSPSDRSDTPETSGRYVFRDTSGREQVFSSLEEMPPEVREIYQRLRPEELSRLNIRRHT